MMNASCADCGRIVAFRTQDPSEQAACRGCGSVVRRSKEMPGVAVGVRHQPEAEAAERAPARRKPEDAKVLTNSEGEPMEPPPIASGNPGNPLGQPDAIMGLLKELRDSVGRLEEGQQKLLARSLSVPEMPVSDKPIKSATGKGAWGPLAIKNPFPTTPFRSTEIALVPRSLEELESERSYFVPEEEPKTPLSESRELSSDFYSKFGLAELDLSDGVTAAPDARAVSEGAKDEAGGYGISSENELAGEESGEAGFADGGEVFDESEEALEPTGRGGSLAEGEAEGLKPAGRGDSPEEESSSPSKTEEIAEKAADREEKKEEAEPEAGDPEPDDLLAAEIRAAKEHQRQGNGAFGRFFVILLLLAGVVAVLYLLNQRFAWWKPAWLPQPEVESVTSDADPLFSLPAPGRELAAGDERFALASRTAKRFLDSESASQATTFVLPGHRELLPDFFDRVYDAYTVSLIGGWELPGDEARVDFLFRDLNQPPRILPVVKKPGQPWLVDFKTYRGCEEVTLEALSLGGLTLRGDLTKVIEEASVRVWIRPCPQRGSFREGHVAYCLHNLAEDPLGIGAAKKGSRIDQHLREALAETEVRHRGLPALRAILRVRLTVTKEGEEPARFLITEVIDTEWDETGLSSR